MDNKYLASFFLRVGLGTVFLYAAIASLLSPGSWSVFIPDTVNYILKDNIFLTIFSISEIVLSLWLFSGKKTYIASIVASVTIILIIIFNIESLDLIFRDIAILASALALMSLSKEK
ncbi:DoxX family membrane protein [Candidatus Woesearchaeota archaeon]|nr:DoxX family membrane protein [Candidatus Woesearchaeota archaeon]